LCSLGAYGSACDVSEYDYLLYISAISSGCNTSLQIATSFGSTTSVAMMVASTVSRIVSLAQRTLTFSVSPTNGSICACMQALELMASSFTGNYYSTELLHTLSSVSNAANTLSYFSDACVQAAVSTTIVNNISAATTSFLVAGEKFQTVTNGLAAFYEKRRSSDIASWELSASSSGSAYAKMYLPNDLVDVCLYQDSTVTGYAWSYKFSPLGSIDQGISVGGTGMFGLVTSGSISLAKASASTYTISLASDQVVSLLITRVHTEFTYGLGQVPVASAYTVQVVCKSTVVETKYVKCENSSTVFEVKCEGEDTTTSVSCPGTQTMCVLWDGTAFVDSGCTLLFVGDKYTQCLCSNYDKLCGVKSVQTSSGATYTVGNAVYASFTQGTTASLYASYVLKRRWTVSTTATQSSPQRLPLVPIIMSGELEYRVNRKLIEWCSFLDWNLCRWDVGAVAQRLHGS
jgi:hypothetical protein